MQDKNQIRYCSTKLKEYDPINKEDLNISFRRLLKYINANSRYNLECLKLAKKSKVK